MRTPKAAAGHYASLASMFASCADWGDILLLAFGIFASLLELTWPPAFVRGFKAADRVAMQYRLLSRSFTSGLRILDYMAIVRPYAATKI